MLSNKFFLVTSILNQHSSWLHLLSKNLFSEQILLKRRAWLYGMDFLEWYMWQDESSKCWWISVGLIYKSARSLFLERVTSTSKKLTLSKEYSAVSFIVVWQLFNVVWQLWKLVKFFQKVICVLYKRPNFVIMALSDTLKKLKYFP